MKPASNNQRGSLRRSAGVGLVTAIFLLVVLAGLGVAMVSVFSSQQAASTLDEQGARAYQAARAGAEWALFKQLQEHDCENNPSHYPATFQLPPNSTLSAFTVTVSCVQKKVASGNSFLNRYVITSVACNQQGPNGCPNPSNSPDYVQRVVEVAI
jgi:MSHA biogenesis protein MshP